MDFNTQTQPIFFILDRLQVVFDLCTSVWFLALPIFCFCAYGVFYVISRVWGGADK